MVRDETAEAGTDWVIPKEMCPHWLLGPQQLVCSPRGAQPQRLRTAWASEGT